MSIATRTGDQGTTGLMYNRRVPKDHPRIEAAGSVDELNAAIGTARACRPPAPVEARLLEIQQTLVILMGEIATLPDDLSRYEKDGFKHLTGENTRLLDEAVRAIESQNVSFAGWATPGANPLSAALDVARTVCRRAERRVAPLIESGAVPNREILVYLNRLSDLLWLMARQAE